MPQVVPDDDLPTFKPVPLDDLPGARPAKEPGLIERAKQGLSSTVTAGKIFGTNDPDEIARLVAEEQRTKLPATAAQRRMAEEIQPYTEAYNKSEGLDAVGKFASLAAKRLSQFVSNPSELAGSLIENLPNSAPGIAGGIAGAAGGAATPVPFGTVIGGVAGGTAGGYLVEQGSAMRDQILKEAQARNIDPSNPKALEPLIREKYDEFLSKSRLKGVGTAGTDAVLNVLTVGLAGAGERALVREGKAITEGVAAGAVTAEQAAARVAALEAANAARNTIGAKTLRGAGIMAGEGAGEGLSEAAGQKLAYGQVDALDVVDEAILGVGTGAGISAGRGLINRAIGQPTGGTIEESLKRAQVAAGLAQEQQTGTAADTQLDRALDRVESARNEAYLGTSDGKGTIANIVSAPDLGTAIDAAEASVPSMDQLMQQKREVGAAAARMALGETVASPSFDINQAVADANARREAAIAGVQAELGQPQVTPIDRRSADQITADFEAGRATAQPQVETAALSDPGQQLESVKAALRDRGLMAQASPQDRQQLLSIATTLSNPQLPAATRADLAQQAFTIIGQYQASMQQDQQYLGNTAAAGPAVLNGVPPTNVLPAARPPATPQAPLEFTPTDTLQATTSLGAAPSTRVDGIEPTGLVRAVDESGPTGGRRSLTQTQIPAVPGLPGVADTLNVNLAGQAGATDQQNDTLLGEPRDPGTELAKQRVAAGYQAPPAAPRPQKVNGTPAAQLTVQQLEQIAADQKLPAIARRGAQIELGYRRSEVQPQAVQTTPASPDVPPTGPTSAEMYRNTMRYASGLSAVSDLGNGAVASGGLETRGVGVDVGQLSKNAITAIGNAVANLRTALFVDSGAFGAFRRGLKSGQFAPMDFDAILSKYDNILDAIDEANPAEETDYPRPRLVMPDVVGNQTASLELLGKYKTWISAEANGNRAQLIIPIQKGKLSMADAYRAAVSTLGTDNFIVGIPSNEAAVSPQELAEFLRDARPKAIHVLGAASEKNLTPRLQSVIDSGLAGQIEVTADASPIRSAVLNAVAKGAKRGDAIKEFLFDQQDPALARDNQQAGIKASEQRDVASEETTVAPEATQQGKPVSSLGNITTVDPATLPTNSKANSGTISKQTHRMISLIASMFGKRIVLFSSDNDQAPDGFVRRGDGKTIYLNVKSQISHLVVFGHELLHQLKADNPQAYEALVKVIKLKEGADTNVAGIRGDMEELTADVVGNRFRETEFWQDVFREILASGKDTKVSQKSAMRLGASVVRAVDRMVKALKGMTGFNTDSMVENLQEVKSAVTKALASYAQAQRGEATELIREQVNASRQESQQGSVQQERGSGNESGRAAEAGPGNRVLGAAQGEGPEDQAGQGVKASEKRPGQLDNVEAYHYSKAPRSVLSSGAYGTNYAGSGKQEYQTAADQRRRQRVYFYVDKGTGVRPESGVGGYPHKASLNNVYDINEDPLKLKAGSQAQTESNILDAGFSGYLDRLEGSQPGQVIMLGKQDIPVQPLPPGTQVKAGAQYSTMPTESQWESVATNMTRAEADQKVARMRTMVGWRGYEIRVAPVGPRAAIQVKAIPEPAVKASDKRALPGAPDIKGATGPDPQLVRVAEQYAQDNGIELSRQAEYVDVDEARAKRIAAAYDAMPHAPNDPKVREAYGNLIRQTRAQYDALIKAGYQFTFFDSKSDPYQGNPWNAMRDLRDNKRMAVYGTYDGYGTEGVTQGAVEDNPMLADTGLTWRDQAGVQHPVTANDLFRAVHDAFGHGLEGAGFRARGEENAWQAHVRLFTGSAVGAITSETRGQNSWLNYGPYGLQNRNAKLEGTVFADQKTGLMPSWTWTEGRVGDMAEEEEGAILASEKRKIEEGKVVYQSDPLTPEQWQDVRRIGMARMNEEQRKAIDAAEQGVAVQGKRADEDSVRYAQTAQAALDKMPVPQLSTVPVMQDKIKLKIEPTGKMGKDGKRKARVFDVARALRNRFLRRAGDINTEQGREALARAMVHEALYALSKDGHAVGWYDRKVTEAIVNAAVAHPQILMDPESNFIFRVVLAVTSNGQAVRDNFAFGNSIIKSWFENGRLPEEFDGGGARSPAMKIAFAKINRLVEEHGWEKTQEELMKLRTVREIENAFGLKISGENKETLVPTAVGMGGPKIGNFYANLSGFFDNPTMDLWFMRTVGRMAGTNMATKPGLIKYLDELTKILPEKGEVYGIDVQEIRDEIATYKGLSEDEQMDPDLTIEALSKTEQYARKQYSIFSRGSGKVYEDGKTRTFDDRSPANLNARSIVNNLSALVEAPGSGGERNNLRAVVQRALALLAQQGIKLNAADMQAVLWYYEKNLYGKLGNISESAKPWDYASAARFGVGRELGLVDVKPSKAAGQVRAGEPGQSDLEQPGSVRDGVPGPDQEVKASEKRIGDTSSPEFKGWFGNSKLVDKDGNPLILYHGTQANNIRVFKRSEDGALGPGIYLTESMEGAGGYAGEGGTVEMLYARMERPLIVYTGKDEAALQIALDDKFWKENFFVRGAARKWAQDQLEDWAGIQDPEFPQMLKDAGYDGVILKNPETGEIVEAMVPSSYQVKSALNDGEWSRSNPDIYASEKRNIFGQKVLANWTAPTDSKLLGMNRDSVIYKLQDKMVDTKRVVDAIRSTVGQIQDKFNAYLQEELYHGRTAKQTKDFLEDELKPLTQAMTLNKVTIADLEEYLHNRHAEERNRQIAKINPTMPDGGSGIDTADARAYLAGLDPAKRRIYDALARRVDAITKETRELLVRSGLETRETVDAWENAYGSYVPLFREDTDYGASGGMGSGQGFSVRGAASRRATGSERPVVDILANVAMQRERAIVRGEKTRVATALYGLAVQNPNTDFWLAVDPNAIKDVTGTMASLVNMGINPLDVQNIIQEPKQTYVDPRTGLVTQRVNPALRSNDNVLAVRINGEDKYVFFNNNDERAARMVGALKNLDANQLGQIMSISAKVSRYFAAVNTQYNPIFGAINLMRDTQGAAFNLTTTPIADRKAQVMAGIMPAVVGIYADLRSRRAGNGPTQGAWAQLWEEFQDEGGQTGFRDMFKDSTDRAKSLQAEIDQIAEGKLKQAGRGIFNWLSDYNETLENAVRLSAYKAAKDKGLSNQQAASIAKNLTVNFNRKGEIGVQAGALYAFFNASVQGTQRLAETLTGPAGKKILAGGLLLGTAQALLLAAAGFKDDEPPDFIKERNLVIPTGDGKYVTIPMPLGLHVIPNTSRVLTEWALSGWKKPTKRIAQITGAFLDAFNPLGNAGWSGQTFMPTFADPVIALFENKDWTGKPIAKEDMSKSNPTPGYTRAKDTASWLSKELSYYLNLATGGTKYTKGLLSPTPDQLDYLIGQVTGGVGREALKVQQTVESAFTGEELPSNKVPILGRFYGDTKEQSAVSSRFFENITQLNEHENEIKGRIKNREGGVSEYRKENPEAKLVGYANQVERDVAEMRRRKREMLAKGASPESIKILEERITRRMKQLNDRVDAVAQ